MNSVAAYSKSIQKDILHISKVKSQNPDSDFFIFTDFFMHNGGFADIAILSSFYMKFFKGTIYFFDKEEYESNKNLTIANCVLMGSNNDKL